MMRMTISKVNMNTLRNNIAVFLSAIVLSACSSVFDRHVEWQNVKPEQFPSVQGIIRGAKVVKSYPVGDSYTTELSLDFKDVYEIYNASSNRQEIKHITYY